MRGKRKDCGKLIVAIQKHKEVKVVAIAAHYNEPYMERP